MDPGVGFGVVGGIAGLMFVAVPVLMVAIVALGIYAAVKGYREAQRRNAAIAATVSANHLGHLDEDPGRTEIFASPPFQMGRNRRARDIVWGTFAGRPFETFAYSYETESTDSQGKTTTTTHHFQVTWVPLPGSIATMRLTSDNGLLRLAAKLGARDLDVESHAFNQQWKVWCEDERAGHAVLTPRMIERFLQGDVGGRGFVFEGRALMSYAPVVSDLAELPLVVGMLHQIVDLIPPFVFETPGAAAAGA